MVGVAPMFGSRWVAIRYRAVLTLVLVMLIAPTVSQQIDQTNWVGALGGELVVGIVLGLGLRLLIAGFSMAGDLISALVRRWIRD